jgi:hypothetical protein
MLNDPNNQLVDGTFTLVQIHIGPDGLPNWPARNTFYGVGGTPTAVFDAKLFYAGAYTNTQQMYNWYLAAYNQRRVVPTDVTITGTGVESTAQTITVYARVCLEPTGGAKTVRVYMTQLLDYYGCSYCRNTFMQAATFEDVALAPGECAVVTRSFTYDSTNWANRTNSKIVIWAQQPAANGPQGNPAEMYQAHTLSWPFPGPDCNVNGIPDADDIAAGSSLDCNINGVPDECDIASGASADANGNGVPDECELMRGDMNCDGSVNFGDINPFVMLIVDPTQWQQAYPSCLLLNGDCNLDGTISFADINPFIALLTPPP